MLESGNMPGMRRCVNLLNTTSSFWEDAGRMLDALSREIVRTILYGKFIRVSAWLQNSKNGAQDVLRDTHKQRESSEQQRERLLEKTKTSKKNTYHSVFASETAGAPSRDSPAGQPRLPSLGSSLCEQFKGPEPQTE